MEKRYLVGTIGFAYGFFLLVWAQEMQSINLKLENLIKLNYESRQENTLQDL